MTLFSIIIDAYGRWTDTVWVLGDDRVDGAAVWLPPDDVKRFDDVEATTTSKIAALTDDGGARYAALWGWLGGHLPDAPCWFLDILAVRRAARGRGNASGLVRLGLRSAHAERLPAFLETGNPANVP